MRRNLPTLFVVAILLSPGWAHAQAAQPAHLAPPSASSSGRLTPVGEPGPALSVSGVVVDAEGKPVAGASLYAFQTDAEGYYGVKPASSKSCSPVTHSSPPRCEPTPRSPSGPWKAVA